MSHLNLFPLLIGLLCACSHTTQSSRTPLIINQESSEIKPQDLISQEAAGINYEVEIQATKGWTLIWHDEFNQVAGTAIDDTKWVHDIGGHGWGNQQLEYNTDRTENVAHDGTGLLIITGRTENFSGNGYTAARIKTKDKFTQQYGRFEARIQLPKGQGLWPAFWLLGDNIDQVNWPHCGEIDIMEFRGQQVYESTAAIHGPGYSADQSKYGTYKSSSDLTLQFHTFAMEWDQQMIRWYVDDQLFHQVTKEQIPTGTSWVFDHSFFILLNLAIGGNYVGAPNLSTQFPTQLRIDYVRVFQASE